MLMIFVYILSRSTIHDMNAHLQFVKQFSTPYILNSSREGFCITTLEVALGIVTGEPDAI